ncbi:MAG: 5-nucleotidase / UDP-sugar diphosphatase, partial [Thermosipho sp. (in: thermotogales)]|nr:5-nucleotidase / UDP-sugar diphosphatase [Thermosipho sp. (in: thermotogales)]
MRKTKLVLFLLLLVAISLFATKLTVFHINDTHGHAWTFSEYKNPDIGGFAVIASIIDEERAVNPNVLFLHAGDINTGVPESDLLNALPDIFALNRMKLDAMAVGNHEFDKDRSVLEYQMSIAKFPFLSANIYKDGKPFFTPYIIKNVGGVKVAIIGFTTEETAILEPLYSSDLEFKNVVEVAKELVPKLREEADVVIALTHLGMGMEHAGNYTTSEQLAQEVEGIDIIIDGHSHTKLEEAKVINNTIVVQAWEWGKILGKLELDVEDGKIVDWNWTPIPVKLADFEEALYVKVPLDVFKKMGSEKLDTVIGETKILLDGERSHVRSRDTNLGHLITDAMLWKTGADVALQNGGGIRASIQPGKITIRDILTVLPFGNTVYVMKLKGSELLKVLEYAASLEEGKGAWLHVGGLTWKSVGAKVTEVMVNGEPLDPDKVYTVVTNNYMAGGGDGYTVLKENKDSGYDTGFVLADVVVEYIQKGLNGKIESYDDTPRYIRMKEEAPKSVINNGTFDEAIANDPENPYRWWIWQASDYNISNAKVGEYGVKDGYAYIKIKYPGGETWHIQFNQWIKLE